MTPEQKKRIAHEISNWNNAAKSCLHPATETGDRMAALLQELIEAPAPEPVARVTDYYAGYLSVETVDGRVLSTGTALYAAPPAPTPAEVPTDVARLDWLIASNWYVGPEYGADEAGGIVGYDNKNIDGLRAEIDAAIATEKGGA